MIAVAALAPALCVTLTVSAPERGLPEEPSWSRDTVSDVPAALPTSEKVPPPRTSMPVLAAVPSRSRFGLFVIRLSSTNVPPFMVIAPEACRFNAAVPASRSVAPVPMLKSFSISSVPLKVCTAVPRTTMTPV